MSLVRDRSTLVELLRHRLTTQGFPRLQMLGLLATAGGGAFLISVLGKRAGIDHLGLRYSLATLAGYATFLALLRLWISWQRGRREQEADLDLTSAFDASDLLVSGDAPDAAPSVFGSGRSGGAGATGEWGRPGPAQHARTAVEAQVRSTAGDVRGGASDAASLDLGDLWPVVVAALCATGGLVIIGYTVYMAPILLAEVALDAAVVTTLYRRLRREDAGTWVGAALRRTWGAALAITILMGIAGTALQIVAPDARSLGQVVSHLRSR